MLFGDKSIHFSILFLQELMLSFHCTSVMVLLYFFTEIIGLAFQFCSFLFRFKALLSSKPASDSTCIEINYVKYPIFQVQSSLNLNGTCKRNTMHALIKLVHMYLINQSSGFTSTGFISVRALQSAIDCKCAPADPATCISLTWAVHMKHCLPA